MVFGASQEVIDGLVSASPYEDFEVFPENWEIVGLFMKLQTQWVFASTGHPLGLNYAAVDSAMRRLRVQDEDGRIFSGIQIMEWAALDALKD